MLGKTINSQTEPRILDVTSVDGLNINIMSDGTFVDASTGIKLPDSYLEKIQEEL